MRIAAWLLATLAMIDYVLAHGPFEEALLLMLAALVCAVLSLSPSTSWLARKWRDAYDDAQRRQL